MTSGKKLEEMARKVINIGLILFAIGTNEENFKSICTIFGTLPN